MKKNPLVTVALFNFNGYLDTIKCLDSLLHTNYKNFEIFLIDDGSKNDELSVIKKKFKNKKITFYKDGKNKGFSARCNQVLSTSKAEYVMLLNNDTTVDKNWLTELVTAAEKDKKIGICQSKLLAMNNPEYFEYAGAVGGYIDKLGYPYARGRVVFHLEKDAGQYNTPEEIFWACGAAMLIRKSVIKKAGMLDIDLFAYMEEIDFCWRVKKAGYKIMSVPSSVIFHKGTGYWSQQQSRKTYLVHRNNLMILLEHFSTQKLLTVIPIRIILDYASIIFYIVTDKPSYVMAVVKAHFYIFTHIGQIYRKRRMKFWSQKMLETESQLFPRSVLWCYFIEKKKRFSEINYQKSSIPTIYYQDMLDIGKVASRRNSIKKMLRK